MFRGFAQFQPAVLLRPAEISAESGKTAPETRESAEVYG